MKHLAALLPLSINRWSGFAIGAIYAITFGLLLPPAAGKQTVLFMFVSAAICVQLALTYIFDAASNKKKWVKRCSEELWEVIYTGALVILVPATIISVVMIAYTVYNLIWLLFH